jgi:two-component system chemotaxis response regulator CheV
MNTVTKNDKSLNDANERSNLAGNNKMELLIFGLVDEKTGTTMDCGINVFKVRDVLETPPINSIPLTNYRTC